MGNPKGMSQEKAIRSSADRQIFNHSSAIIFPGNSRQQGTRLLGRRKGSPLMKTGS
jgi:hypothetical protein